MQKRVLDLIWNNLGDIKYISEEERKYAGDYDLTFVFRRNSITLQKRGGYVDTPYSLDGLDSAPSGEVEELYDYLVQERLRRDRERDRSKADREFSELTRSGPDYARIALYAGACIVTAVFWTVIFLNSIS